MRTLLVLAFLAVLTAGATFGYQAWHGGESADASFQTEPAIHGDLLSTFSATGTVEPEDVIDVGAQVAGRIKEFGVDQATGKPIDYGSAVEPGAILAQIDDALYRAKVEQSRAQVRSMERKVDQARARVDQSKAKVDQAKANVLRAEADLRQTQAKLAQADRDWDRARRLRPGSAISQLEFDTAQATYETNKALVGVAEAALAQAKAAQTDSEAFVVDAIAFVGDAEASVANSQALLRQDEINLGYTVITAPVKGVIIDRRVTLGQTVQSSFNTPSLFLLARDMKRMKVWASVNEADIGQVELGQPVKFTVDAHPGKVFRGEVGRIRYNATMTQNVVTYTVEVVTDNSDGILIPYLTANLKFEVGRRSGALLVPNAALRWKPAPDQVAFELRDDLKKPRRAGDDYLASGEGASMGTVWVADGAYVRPLQLRLGLSDGNFTEVTEGELADGTGLVVNDAGPVAAGDDAGTKNPFAPPSWAGKAKRR